MPANAHNDFITFCMVHSQFTCTPVPTCCFAAEAWLKADSFVSKFPDFASLRKFAEQTSDNELLGKLRIVLSHTHNVPSHVRAIRAKTVHNMHTASTIASTPPASLLFRIILYANVDLHVTHVHVLHLYNVFG